MEQHRLKQLELKSKRKRDNKQHHKNGNARQDFYLRHYVGATAQKRGPGINDEHGLALIEAFVNKAVMNVPLVGLTHTNVGAAAANDGRKGIDNRNSRNNKWHKNGSKTSYTRYAQQGDNTHNKAHEKRSAIAQENGCWMKIVFKKGKRAASKRNGKRSGIEATCHNRKQKHGCTYQKRNA